MIKVGFCVAYDWYLLQYSLPLIYKEADIICLSVDKDRISWAGNSFSWDEVGFQELVKGIDVDNKIKIIEEDYHLPELQPMQNEVRQRNKIAKFMGESGWHIQLDADEYFINFNKFVKYLKKNSSKHSLNIWCPYITLFKQVNEGYLIIDQKDFFKTDGNPIATNDPAYKFGRISDWFNRKSSFYIIHQSWARNKEEIKEKVNNWGHKNDFDTKYFFKQWDDLNIENFKFLKNFHPIKTELWPELVFVKANSIEDMLNSVNDLPLNLPSSFRLGIKNSLFISRLRKILGV